MSLLRTEVKIDARKLRKMSEEKIHDYLMRLAAYIMRTAQRSMRYRSPRGKPAPPGSPPKAARNNPLLRKVWERFSVRVSPPVVVVGPKHFRSSGNVPAVHEFGGVLKVSKTRRARYPARPYLAPALKIALERVRR
jgi:phage gpG-like protein